MKKEVPQEITLSKQANLGDSALVNLLLPEEYNVYVWLLQAYNINWIAETLGLDKQTVKTLARNVYKTLKVNDQRDLVRYYFSPEKYAAHANGKPALTGEELAYFMAVYTNQCVESILAKKAG